MFRCFPQSVIHNAFSTRLKIISKQAYLFTFSIRGDRGSAVVKVLCYKSEGRSQLVSLEFFIDIKSFRSHYGPGVDPASNRNEY